jgi:hypothetical protein
MCRSAYPLSRRRFSSSGNHEVSPHARPDPPAAQDDGDRKLLADIERHGWHMLGITEDNDGPAFAYSVGLWHSFEHPEILVIGLGTDVMFGMINGIGEAVRDGNRFEHLFESGDILAGFNVAFRRVEPRYYKGYVGYALWYYQSDDFPILQCVWPDSQHRYPWHPEWPAGLVVRQPVLSDDCSWPFHEGINIACFTTRRVLEGLPILRVSHDSDGDWQFLCGTTTATEDAALVSLAEMLRLDDTLVEVADLAVGWAARRDGADLPWLRELIG